MVDLWNRLCPHQARRSPTSARVYPIIRLQIQALLQMSAYRLPRPLYPCSETATSTLLLLCLQIPWSWPCPLPPTPIPPCQQLSRVFQIRTRTSPQDQQLTTFLEGVDHKDPTTRTTISTTTRHLIPLRPQWFPFRAISIWTGWTSTGGNLPRIRKTYAHQTTSTWSRLGSTEAVSPRRRTFHS